MVGRSECSLVVDFLGDTTYQYCGFQFVDFNGLWARAWI